MSLDEPRGNLEGKQIKRMSLEDTRFYLTRSLEKLRVFEIWMKTSTI